MFPECELGEKKLKQNQISREKTHISTAHIERHERHACFSMVRLEEPYARWCLRAGPVPGAPGCHSVLYCAIRDKCPALRREALALVVISAHAVHSFISIMFNLLICGD